MEEVQFTVQGAKTGCIWSVQYDLRRSHHKKSWGESDMCHLLRRRKHTIDINGCEQRSGKQDFVFIIWKNLYLHLPSRVRISHSQFPICESLKSDNSWIFSVIHWTSYIVSYFKLFKYSLMNSNVISQSFIIHINFKLHTSFFSN